MSLFPASVYVTRKGETKGQKEARLWKPVRTGALYCAPRCSAGCTWADYRLATERAAALCKLLGPGWRPHVWENFGWHYQATKALAEVHANHWVDGVSYCVWLQTEVGSMGTQLKGMMQIIVDVPRKRDGTHDIKATLKKALNMKRKAAATLIAEAEAVEA